MGNAQGELDRAKDTLEREKRHFDNANNQLSDEQRKFDDAKRDLENARASCPSCYCGSCGFWEADCHFETAWCCPAQAFCHGAISVAQGTMDALQGTVEVAKVAVDAAKSSLDVAKVTVDMAQGTLATYEVATQEALKTIAESCTGSCEEWGCTCQGMSDAYGTDHGVTWGSAPSEARDWWDDNHCTTKPTGRACSDGYTELSGDIGGWGTVNGKGGGVAVSVCDECAELCNGDAECRSYECSPSRLQCNLNAGADPTNGSYLDFAFCQKGRRRISEAELLDLNGHLRAEEGKSLEGEKIAPVARASY